MKMKNEALSLCEMSFYQTLYLSKKNKKHFIFIEEILFRVRIPPAPGSFHSNTKVRAQVDPLHNRFLSMRALEDSLEKFLQISP